MIEYCQESYLHPWLQLTLTMLHRCHGNKWDEKKCAASEDGFPRLKAGINLP